MRRFAEGAIAAAMLVMIGVIAFSVGAIQANLSVDADDRDLMARARAVVHGRAACAGLLRDLGAQVIGIDPAAPRLLQIDFTCDGVRRGIFTNVDGSPIK